LEEQYELFEASPGERSEPVAARLDKIRPERVRRFGDVWLGWRLWRALALDRFCDDRLVEGREWAPWPAIAAILVIARCASRRASFTLLRIGTPHGAGRSFGRAGRARQR
jgi:hypothetical protein